MLATKFNKQDSLFPKIKMTSVVSSYVQYNYSIFKLVTQKEEKLFTVHSTFFFFPSSFLTKQ